MNKLNLSRARAAAGAPPLSGTEHGTAGQVRLAPPETPELLYRRSPIGVAVWNTLYDGTEQTAIRYAVITGQPNGPDVDMALYDQPPPAKRPIGRYDALTGNPLMYNDVMLPLFQTVWDRYGDSACVILDPRGNVWVASRQAAIQQYLSRRPPIDPEDERFVLPPMILQIRRVAAIFVDGDPFLNATGAILCVLAGLCVLGSGGLWILFAVRTLALAMYDYPVTAGGPIAAYYFFSVCFSVAELAAFLMWQTQLANRFLKPLMAVDVGYHFFRGLVLSAAGFSLLASTPLGASQETAGFTHIALPHSGEAWGAGLFSGVISAACSIGPQVAMVAFGFLAYQLWPLLRVELPATMRVRHAELGKLKEAAGNRVADARRQPASANRVRWVIDQATNEVHEVHA